MGKMLELGIDMTAGDVVEVESTSDGAPVVWNLHSHDGTERPRQAEGRAAADNLQLAAPQDGQFWSLWTNDRSETVEVEVRFRLAPGSALLGWRDEL
jgi:hypothetical protein